MDETGTESRSANEARAERPIVLVGMMGAGKSSIGRRLARRLGRRFRDADSEIESAAGKSIPEIFADHGEPYFRAGERRVIARLLHESDLVLATGGGAFVDPHTRAEIAARGVSVWLKADLDVLMRRVRRRTNRPLLRTDDPRATMRRLMDERDPLYAQADIVVASRDVPHEVIVDEVLTALQAHSAAAPTPARGEAPAP